MGIRFGEKGGKSLRVTTRRILYTQPPGEYITLVFTYNNLENKKLYYFTNSNTTV